MFVAYVNSRPARPRVTQMGPILNAIWGPPGQPFWGPSYYDRGLQLQPKWAAQLGKRDGSQMGY